MNKTFAVAIDGPAGAGKSTMARAVAKDLGFVYVDTGAIYRTVGYYVTLCGIGPRDVDGVTRLIGDISIRIVYDEKGEQRMMLNGMDVTDEIRTAEMGDCASKLSTLKVVRDYLLEVQRDLAKSHSVIMDGRDIGTVVLPQADVKIFLTASAEVRAQRRLKDFRDKGDMKSTLDSVLRDIRQRDERDMNREIAPLKQAKDAILLDTSSLSPEESVFAIKRIIEEKIKW